MFHSNSTINIIINFIIKIESKSYKIALKINGDRKRSECVCVDMVQAIAHTHIYRPLKLDQAKKCAQ